MFKASLAALAVMVIHAPAAQAAMTRAVSSPEILPAWFSLKASGPVAAALNGSTFSWANQGGAGVSGVTANGGLTAITLSQPPHGGSTNQAALMTGMAQGSACYAILMQSPASTSLYNSGMVMMNAASGAAVIFQDIYANDAQSNLYVVTETDFVGHGQHALSTGSYRNYTAGSEFFQRICIDSTNKLASFAVSPTGSADSFQVLATVALSVLGNPDHVGFYTDANPQDSQTYTGTLNVFSWQATPGYLPQAAAPWGDHFGGFQTVPVAGNGFPVSNYLPSLAGDTPKFGLALAAGATNIAALTFPGSGEARITVPDSATFRRDIYLNFDEGDLNNLVGFPQDSGQGPTAPFYGRARSYPAGSTTDLIPVTADGLKVKSHCSAHMHLNCTPDQVRSGFFRLPTVFRPGMTMEITFRPPTGFSAWVPWWLYTGQQLTPYPNSNAYAPGLSYVSHGPNFEIDMNDNFARRDYGGCPIGGQVDFGTPNLYGVTWRVAPRMVYAANSNGWASRNWGDAGNSTSNNYECETGFLPGSLRTITFNWRNDGTNLMDEYVDGRRVNSAYMEYPQTQSFTDPDGVKRVLGMTMLIGGQNVPVFNNQASVVDNDGIVESATHDGGWTETIYAIKAWQGNLANPDGYDAGVNAVR